MKMNQIDQEGQNTENKQDQPVPQKNKEFKEMKPGINHPDNNDPTREDKPPLIISIL